MLRSQSVPPYDWAFNLSAVVVPLVALRLMGGPNRAVPGMSQQMRLRELDHARQLCGYVNGTKERSSRKSGADFFGRA